MTSLNWRSNLIASTEIETFCAYLNSREGIHQHGDGSFWWYDETGADEFGGFATFEEALASAAEYGKSL